jgi:hypothetical protein
VQQLAPPPNVPGAAFLADYRFPARGDASFRTRLYAVRPDALDANSLRMRIFRLDEEAMAELARVEFDASAVSWGADAFAEDRHIPDCDVRWRYVPPGGPLGRAHFDGELANGDATVFSPVLKQTITVTDSLQLFDDALWINDRGFDSAGNQIYGNWRGVPYKLGRAHH